MGVIMTPPKGLAEWLAVFAVAGGVVACCATVVVIQRADRVISGKTPGLATKESPASSAPLMVWSGRTELGFTRAELWPGNDDNYPQELVISASGHELPTRMRITVTKIPERISTSNGVAAVFVSPPAERPGRENGILAAVTKDGTLQIFAVGQHTLWQPCDLAPASGSWLK